MSIDLLSDHDSLPAFFRHQLLQCARHVAHSAGAHRGEDSQVHGHLYPRLELARWRGAQAVVKYRHEAGGETAALCEDLHPPLGWVKKGRAVGGTAIVRGGIIHVLVLGVTLVAALLWMLLVLLHKSGQLGGKECLGGRGGT